MTEIKNKIYRLHKWLDDNELYKLILLLLIVSCPIILINTYLIYIGIFMFILLSLFVITRVLYIDNKLKFNRLPYKIPQIGDEIVIIKDLKINISKNYKIKLIKGKNAKIVDIKEVSGDWKMWIKARDVESVEISYLKYKRYWKEKSEIRDNSLKKIGI